MLRQRALVTEILAKHTRQSLARIERDIERDLILNAEQALSYGLIDAIHESRVSDQKKAVEIKNSRPSVGLTD
jgi:ATP-dependent Clp protease protease subunit